MKNQRFEDTEGMWKVEVGRGRVEGGWRRVEEEGGGRLGEVVKRKKAAVF